MTTERFGRGAGVIEVGVKNEREQALARAIKTKDGAYAVPAACALIVCRVDGLIYQRGCDAR